MVPLLDTERGRREFLLASVRYLMLGALALLSGILFSRRHSASPETCINLEICKGCPAFRGCSLPPALSTRAKTQEASHAG